jgi:hypothetical protein
MAGERIDKEESWELEEKKEEATTEAPELPEIKTGTSGL